MHTEELRAFLAVVDKGSIKAAATSIDSSRATVRRRIEELEARMKAPLLKRTRRGTETTATGLRFAEKARDILVRLDQLKLETAEVGAAPSGTLRVLLPLGLPPGPLITLLKQVQSLYPQLHIQMDFSYDPLEDLTPDVDLALYMGRRLPRGAWISRTIFRLRERLLAHPLYLERHGVPGTIEALADHRLIAWEHPGCAPDVWQTLSGEDFRISAALITPDVRMMRTCVASALGIGLMPDNPHLYESPPSTDLVPVLGDLVGRQWPVRLIWPENMSQIPRVRAILNELTPMLSKPPA